MSGSTGMQMVFGNLQIRASRSYLQTVFLLSFYKMFKNHLKYFINKFYQWKFSDGPQGIDRRVLLVCHKNKWLVLWRKLISCFFFYLRGTKNIPIVPKKYFWSMRIFFCPTPLKNQKTTTNKWRVFGTDQITYFVTA